MATISLRSIRTAVCAAALQVLAMLAAPVAAQEMETVDPDTMIDADLLAPQDEDAASTTMQDADSGMEPSFEGAYDIAEPDSRYEQATPVLDLPPEGEYTDATVDTVPAVPVEQAQTTYREDDLIGAAEGLFGEGAEGLARLIQDLLEDQGEPNGYIVGREGGGAFVLGVRYGSGTLHHAVEGNMPVYWTGPSIGLDAGANAGNTFVLVYNLFDTEDLYRRFPAGEGQAYFVGGFTASYVRRGDIVLIPIRVGAGLRLGVNAGYMRFSREQRWLPF
ncbi:DUF1134 domain-containing protein [Aurantiacibacter gangjinensis]|uniref:Uncharacterized protein n=1 Tax=Aurantiacibacter gangjinensis TaxID=502682 RepID=A0A0G9MNV4_9SPHN|nr:DUF1134 domain-containing protein [Aurantiacibacter gangjinensis]APE27900.1 hypothetical protein BMF35_a1071 [Aurantiacibacter gangjinensis]KLE32269.1 hypothetical protein AAW01_10330 [Aurantiacibacter gangjinensis]